MGIISFIVLGLIAGALAKALWKGEEPGGVLGTLLVGVVGALLGGVIASAAGIGGLSSFFSLGTWLIAIGGALLFLAVFNMLAQRVPRRRPRIRLNAAARPREPGPRRLCPIVSSQGNSEEMEWW